jgi:hypothetical protein
MTLTTRLTRCDCGQSLGASGDHTIELHERSEQRRPFVAPWRQRQLDKQRAAGRSPFVAVTDLTGR